MKKKETLKECILSISIEQEYNIVLEIRQKWNYLKVQYSFYFINYKIQHFNILFWKKNDTKLIIFKNIHVCKENT